MYQFGEDDLVGNGKFCGSWEWKFGVVVMARLFSRLLPYIRHSKFCPLLLYSVDIVRTKEKFEGMVRQDGLCGKKIAWDLYHATINRAACKVGNLKTEVGNSICPNIKGMLALSHMTCADESMAML